MSYFVSCATFFGYHNQNYNIKNQNLPEVINDPLDSSIYPNYSANGSRKELVLHIIKNYCPDAFYIINKKNKGTNDNFMKFYFPKTTKVNYTGSGKLPKNFQKIRKTKILRQIGTYVHESNHGYHYSFHRKYFQKKNYYGAGYYFSYYAGNGKTFLVPKNNIFPARVIFDIFPQYMKDDKNLSFRLKTYVYPSGPYQSTQVDGVFGLLDELYSYYHGCLSSYQLFGYIKRNSTDLGNDMKEYFIGVDAVRYAYHEFKLFILLYLIKAQSNFPVVYKQLMNNKMFIRAFIHVDSKFKNLNRKYEATRLKLIPWMKSRGYVLEINSTGTNIKPIKKRKYDGTYTTFGYGHFDDVVKIYEKEMRKKKYIEIIRSLRNQLQVLENKTAKKT